MPPAPSVLRWLIAGIAAICNVRLGTYLLFRIIGKPEEGRCQQLRKEWGGNVGPKFLVFFEFQALLDVFFSLPFLLAALNPKPILPSLEYVGIALWLAVLVGEVVAGAQFAAFKRDPTHHGQVCQRDLWSYSRHPNNLFEWLVCGAVRSGFALRMASNRLSVANALLPLSCNGHTHHGSASSSE